MTKTLYMHVEQIQERNFPRIKTAAPNDVAMVGRGCFSGTRNSRFRDPPTHHCETQDVAMIRLLIHHSRL